MKEKILNNVKVVLFVVMLVLTYFVSNRFVDFVMTVDLETIKRVINMILIVSLVFFYFKSNESKKEYAKKH